MSDVISLTGELRKKAGKGPSRELRRNSMIPAIIYGKNKESVMVSLNNKEISMQYRRSAFMTTIFDINVDGKKYHVLPKDVDLHPVTDEIEHIDFLHVSDNSYVKVTVNLHFINEDKCIGVKRGGVLNIVNREVNLMCNAMKIPHRIDVDLANVDINHSIHLADIQLPKDVTLISNRDQKITIATVVGRGSDDNEKSA
jgi:large subunit ribosomal protein L25